MTDTARGAGAAPASADARLRYEITARVPPAERPAFDRWFSGAVLDWATHPSVAGFRTWRGVDGDGVLLRLTFAFDSRADWERFVGGGAHRERLSRLESYGEDVEVALWAPAAVAVHAADDAVLPLTDAEEAADGSDACARARE